MNSTNHYLNQQKTAHSSLFLFILGLQYSISCKHHMLSLILKASAQSFQDEDTVAWENLKRM